MTSSSHGEESFEQEFSSGGTNSAEKEVLKEIQLHFIRGGFEIHLSCW